MADLDAEGERARGPVTFTHAEFRVGPLPLPFLRDAPAAWAALPDPGPEVVGNVHPTPEMLAQGASCPAGLVGQVGWFTADTACPIGPGTWDAALGAAACALAAAGEAAGGRTAYALCRPPGHHAYAARAGGHCYVNNAALAAQALRDAGAARVAVLDIDSHHGNGTQGIFWDRGDVLTVSVHGDPNRYYPWFVGHAAEVGAGAGAGCNLNLPLAQGLGDVEWLAAIEAGLAAIAAFRADALVVSLGFDASEHEPLGFLRVTADGFARAAAMISAARNDGQWRGESDRPSSPAPRARGCFERARRRRRRRWRHARGPQRPRRRRRPAHHRQAHGAGLLGG
jgi:acetoin utilization deacetylase AcuC-like enzyme